MKTRLVSCLVLLLFVFNGSTVEAQSGYDLYQRALVKERAVGDVEEALRLYQRIVQEFRSNRALAAKAQFRMGALYDRLGRKADAQRAYQMVVTNYSDQDDIVRQARAKIVNGGNGSTLSEKGTKNNASTIPTVRQIWAGAAVDSMGSPSADGRHLSFVDWSTGDLAVRDLENQKTRRITNKGTWAQSDEFAEFSRISPDGRQIAYAWFNAKFYELRVIGLDGSNMRVLYGNPNIIYLKPSAWSSDGKALVTIISKPDRTNQIALISTVNNEVRTLKTTDWRYPDGLRISPDNRWIAYDYAPNEASSKRDIYLLATDGSGEVRLVEHPAHDYMLGWTPDGENIIFASDRTGTISVWLQRVIAGKPQGTPVMIKHDAGQIYPLGLTPDGSLYYSLGGTRDVYVGEFDAVTKKIVSLHNATEQYVGANALPEWSPDGKELAFLSRRSLSQTGIGSRVLVIQSVETGEERVLRPTLDFNRTFRGAPRWSPDGRFLLVVGRDEKGKVGIYRISTQTGEVNPVVQSQPGLELAGWISNSEIIFGRRGFGEDDNAYMVLRDLQSGQEKILHKSRHIHAAAISPDRKQLAFSTEYPATNSKVAMASSLIIMTIASDQTQEILRLPQTEEVEAIAWMPDGQHLLIGQTNNGIGNNKVWWIPVTGGKVEPTELVLWSRQLNGLRFHSDGKRVAFNGATSEGVEILVMENFLKKLKASR